jgi:pimeloyl-ACP methyl ester carboxylesterase
MTAVVLLHGMASSFERNWRDQGWVDLLTEAGREVVPASLLGHGPGPHPTDPDAYADVTSGILKSLVDPVDAIGFSAGAEALLRAAIERPDSFRRLALLGVGGSIMDGGTDGPRALADKLDGPEDPTDVTARLFRRMAAAAGNDLAPIVAYLRRPKLPITVEDLARVRLPVLVVLGDRDPAGPADRLVAALPDARLVTLRGVDHFATASSAQAMAAVLEFVE